jgi:hypothetical protein
MMSPEDSAKLQVEAWKTTVQVQQHFNEIEWKIRGLAITLLTAVLGAAALAINYKTNLHVFGCEVHLAAVLLVAGVVGWLLFYFVDQVWYHRLLIGAVRHGEDLEGLLDSAVEGFGLTRRISQESPYTFNVLGHDAILHSRHKLQVFYGVVAVLLCALAVAVQIGS